ncbi:Zn(II)2Cys6 transcription factor domain-containing protein [Aspergillus undulatus]|uniref:Zn(II)2Cys6 transcription factor domain-containing protein n=1 Tax=Aspergillus undulatus TaxID=1810928 RepID=UPI003CCE1246
MLSMQNTPTSILPPSSDLENNPSHGFLSHPRPCDYHSSLAEPPAFPDYSMNDSLSHRASVSTDDTSNDSPESWDADGPSDSSSPGDAGVKLPTTLVGPSAVFQFNAFASPEEPDVVPKVEELDDDEDIQRIKPLGVETSNPEPHAAAPDASVVPVNVPRKRGRPRKHPLPVPGGQLKVTKGRSKTGCITCRRRKKKCDETKPA